MCAHICAVLVYTCFCVLCCVYLSVSPNHSVFHSIQVGWKLVFGVSALFNRVNSSVPWDSSNAETLFAYTVAQNYSVYAFELGKHVTIIHTRTRMHWHTLARAHTNAETHCFLSFCVWFWIGQARTSHTHLQQSRTLVSHEALSSLTRRRKTILFKLTVILLTPAHHDFLLLKLWPFWLYQRF